MSVLGTNISLIFQDTYSIVNITMGSMHPISFGEKAKALMWILSISPMVSSNETASMLPVMVSSSSIILHCLRYHVYFFTLELSLLPSLVISEAPFSENQNCFLLFLLVLKRFGDLDFPRLLWSHTLVPASKLLRAFAF